MDNFIYDTIRWFQIHRHKGDLLSNAHLNMIPINKSLYKRKKRLKNTLAQMSLIQVDGYGC